MDILPLYVPDLFTPVVAAVAVKLNRPVYYRWGHREEITAALTILDGSKSQKSEKYPLIWLVMDFEETKGDNVQVYSELSASFIIATGTEQNYTEQERRDKTFLPTILPIYAAFVNALSQSAVFRMPFGPLIRHKFLLRPYWGNGKANIFNDFCDVGEIKNLQIVVRAAQNC